PSLILNDHCQVCEFRQRCLEQALKEDNINLLRSLGVKEIKNYARKGILTVTQLAHTFRPRRKPKRAAQASKKRYHSLQALAIRDRRVYVFGKPEMPAGRVAVYLDVESTAVDGFVYLIGMVVVADVYAHVYFPTYSNGLKEVGGWLGCAWTEPDASGLQSIVWRRRWEATGGEEWRQKVLTYNLEDCAAMKRVTDLMYAITAHGGP